MENTSTSPVPSADGSLRLAEGRWRIVERDHPSQEQPAQGKWFQTVKACNPTLHEYKRKG